MIQVSHLSKRFGKTRAIDDISFEVARGEIVGFLGANGAGKTTTMRIQAGFLAASEGRVRVGGLDVRRDSLEVRRLIGYLPENAPLYPEMRVREYLDFRARIKGLYGRRRRERIGAVLSDCNIEDVHREIIGRLSKGYRQRVALADCLLHEPHLFLLDEPALGLDPGQIRRVRQLIKGLAPHHTVLLCTHILAEVEVMCDRVLILREGRIIASDTPERLRGVLKGGAHFRAEIRGPAEAVRAALGAIPSVTAVRGDDGGEWTGFRIETEDGADVRPAIYEAVARNGWSLRELRAERSSLEDVFVAMTGGGPSA
jgi:ABC-2 type transport system ATP-binding protein